MNPFLRTVLLIAATLAISALLAAMLFLAAGRWDMPWLWAYCGVYTVLFLAATLTMDPDLIRERLRPGPGRQDRYVVPGLKVLVMIHLIGGALDVGRFGWSPPMPDWLRLVGLAGIALGFGLAVWSAAVNRFFSAEVRLQTDRGHRVVSGGPYAHVRHPGYVGICVGILASALAMGSWLSALPNLLFAAVLVRRTVMEDRFLRKNLDGYAGYAQTVPYRLFPRIW